MKYITPILAGIFMFFAVGLLSALVLAVVMPSKWWNIYLEIGSLQANIPSLVAMLLGSLAATHSFRATLKAEGKNYRKNKEKNC